MDSGGRGWAGMGEVEAGVVGAYGGFVPQHMQPDEMNSFKCLQIRTILNNGQGRQNNIGWIMAKFI